MPKQFSKLIQILFLLTNINCTDPDYREADNELLLWKKELNQILIANASAGITIDNNVLYFADNYSQLFRINADGKDLKTFDLRNGSNFGVPVIRDSIIVVGTSNSGANPGPAHLYTLNKNTFEVFWSKNNLWWHPVPAIDESQVYCTDLDKVYAFNKTTGQEVWNKRVFGKNAYNPIVENERLYFVTGSVFKEDGYLYCLNKFTGEVIF